MAMILPVANKMVSIGCSNYQSLLDGVQLISLGLSKKENSVVTYKSKIIYHFNILLSLLYSLPNALLVNILKFQAWKVINIIH